MSHSNFQGRTKLPSKYGNIGDSDFKVSRKYLHHIENIPLFYSFKSHNKEERKKPEKTKQDKTPKETKKTLRC